MHLYRGTGITLQADLAAGTLVPRLQKAFFERFLYRATESEARSWSSSLAAVSKELTAARLNEIEVLVEYVLPLTSKRVDVLLVGTYPKKGTISAVIWENKQWTFADIDSVEDRLVKVAGRYSLHPQQQLHQYVEYLRDFNQLAHDGSLTVSGLAFLHIATAVELTSLRSAALTDLADYPMFSGDESGKLRQFLLGHVSSAGAASAADDFLLARTRASKQLLQHVQEQIKGHDAFTLLDEQQVAYDVVRHAVDESRRSNAKKVVIVTGGPGTGKSVIATQILGDRAKRGYNVSHATGSRSFTTTLKKRVGGRAGNLFRYFNNFVGAEANELDVLICDEAHRIRETSNSRFTPRSRRSGQAQVDELIQAARVPMFLLDEKQTVRPGEIGTIEVLREASQKNGADVIQIDLNGQFRCGGSEAYYLWVQRLLGLVPGSPISWEGDPLFELYLAESPGALESWLRSKQANGTARVTAGFCWKWSEPKDGELVEDVVIGDWRRPWNLKPEKRISGIPAASLWASDPGGFGQVGCIYTAQGFEYDYGGVILGRDLVWRSDQWVADASESRDPIVSRAKSTPCLRDQSEPTRPGGNRQGGRGGPGGALSLSVECQTLILCKR